MKGIDPHKNYRYKGEIYDGKTILLARKYRKRDGLSFAAALLKAEVTLERRAARELEQRREQIRDYRAKVKRASRKAQEKELGPVNLTTLDEIEWGVDDGKCLDCTGKIIDYGPADEMPGYHCTQYVHDSTCPTAIARHEAKYRH